ncbi:hypothetical protein TNCV_1311821 [Trichonephila clavipes]|nr:hypothetical protein TNCV_1311821 [Trichonephila clavipes]
MSEWLRKNILKQCPVEKSEKKLCSDLQRFERAEGGKVKSEVKSIDEVVRLYFLVRRLLPYTTLKEKEERKKKEFHCLDRITLV